MFQLEIEIFGTEKGRIPIGKKSIPIRKRNIFSIWPCKLRNGRRRYEDKNKHKRPRERASGQKKLFDYALIFHLRLLFGIQGKSI